MAKLESMPVYYNIIDNTPISRIHIYVCMYVCIYIYVYVYTQTHTHVFDRFNITIILQIIGLTNYSIG